MIKLHTLYLWAICLTQLKALHYHGWACLYTAVAPTLHDYGYNIIMVAMVCAKQRTA